MNTHQLETICNCPGITGRRANLEKTGPDKNNRVESDQRNPPGVCPFVRSLLGRAEAASKSKRQRGAWGSGASQNQGAELVIHHLRAQPEHHHYWLFLSEAEFQGKITLTGLQMSQMNGSVKNYWFVQTSTLHGDLSVQRQLLGTVMRKL